MTASITDCFPRAGGETYDTRRLRDAVEAATGTLIFNEDTYAVHDTITLHTFLNIEGVSPGKYNGSGSSPIASPRVRLVQDSRPLFLIGPGVTQMAIRNLGFYYDNPTAATDATAIKAEGVSTTSSTASQQFQFTNLRFTNFTKGIHVNTTSSPYGWQFDDSHLSDSTFENGKYAVYLNSLNTGWQINNVMIASGANQNGFGSIEVAIYQ